ncbi:MULTISPECIES: hypothetical protein [Myxococcaceae]|uniref:hypothetical protein n=1 Tax=Myxococcaceae TaxID=31 RepID=UPI00188DCC35|nr:MULTISPECIES: hypothetical protein [Myxococcaceae]MBF5042326.1 hypothetical protein [Simulacricoccus sp. 17bor-14]
MYRVDDRDVVVPLTDAPQSNVGAPLPHVLQSGHGFLLAYYMHERDPHWDGSYARMVDAETNEDPVALVQFDLARATYFGAPNDEAFEGHPLAARGLRPYGAYEVRDSSWIRALERMNSVHRAHSPKMFENLRHFIFAFHDEVFECVARGVSWSIHPGPLKSLLPEMQARLRSCPRPSHAHPSG